MLELGAHQDLPRLSPSLPPSSSLRIPPKRFFIVPKKFLWCSEQTFFGTVSKVRGFGEVRVGPQGLQELATLGDQPGPHQIISFPKSFQKVFVANTTDAFSEHVLKLTIWEGV